MLSFSGSTPMMFGLIISVKIDYLIKSSKLFWPDAIMLKLLGLTSHDWLWFLMLLNGGDSNGLFVLYDKPRCSLIRTEK